MTPRARTAAARRAAIRSYADRMQARDDRLLAAIRRGVGTVEGLMRALGLSQPQVYRTVRRLYADGAVTRVPVPMGMTHAWRYFDPEGPRIDRPFLEVR